MPKVKLNRPKVDKLKTLFLGALELHNYQAKVLSVPLGNSPDAAYKWFRKPSDTWRLNEILSVAKYLEIPIEELRKVIGE